MKRVTTEVLEQTKDQSFLFRRLTSTDISALHNMISSQSPDDLRYFNPHGFDIPSLHRQLRNRAFLMMGVFENETPVGYFFLRFFVNRKCFVGRLTEAQYRGRGIGPAMNRIMYSIAWQMNFRCLSTISAKNHLVMKAHETNPHMMVVKKLDDNYMLVEFVERPAQVV